MEKLLSRCAWPGLPENYEQALREAVQFILKRFDVLGIVAAGTIIRGSPDASSDLDIYVIHQAPFRQRVQKFFNGIPTEIFVNPPAMVEKYFIEERVARRPLTAHMLATGFVILELDPVIGQLRQRAAEMLADPPADNPESLIMARYLAATLYEDALDMVQRDPATAYMLLSRAVVEMLHYSFVQVGLYLPRPKELFNVFSGMDLAAAQLARAFFTEPALTRRLKLAEQLADRVLGVRGFFEWESVPDKLEGEK